ncbi:6208_t:CDS:2 [Ambispora leptoticha]|uniref:6208_t:CDS:1 n=1 Tax=Ambispora leptoticha TaxID=144679 RepID=A0A9N9F658_9GLOM|nr:6208_t:CDS:2 [Ambispora leptoticha]
MYIGSQNSNNQVDAKLVSSSINFEQLGSILQSSVRLELKSLGAVTNKAVRSISPL